MGCTWRNIVNHASWVHQCLETFIHVFTAFTVTVVSRRITLATNFCLRVFKACRHIGVETDIHTLDLWWVCCGSELDCGLTFG